MNRRARRAAFRRIATGEDRRVPLFGPGDRVLALVPPEQVRRYEAAPNAQIIRRRDGQAVRIQLRALGDDTGLIVHRGNPRRYSHDHETDNNPDRVWMLRRLAQHESSADMYVRVIFRASILDNLVGAA